MEHLTAPGFVRAAWMAPLFWAIGAGIVVFFRWLGHYDPPWDWLVITVVASLTTAPLGFLAGIGSFDYWLYYISGRPTRPEDHSSHGATAGATTSGQHRPQGDRRPVPRDDVLLLHRGRAAWRCSSAPSWRSPDMQYVDTQTFNGLVSVHAALMIFLFIIPAFAGLANFVVPLMLGAPDMAFPRLNALSYWLLPIAGIMFLAAFLAPGGASAPAGRATRRSPSTSRSATSSSRWASSGPVRRRS